ncbi:MAG: ribosome recycling factor [Gemmatimonadota bacterium]|nr:ribosome recycling factor [Gemmatimonadota bacterium]
MSVVTGGTIAEITKSCRAAMERAIENSRKEFASIRSGKATTSLLDTVRVDAWGSSLPITQVATISAPEPRLLLVTPYDKSQTSAIEKSIRDSDLGLNPSSQGGIIRVPLPSLNEERRRELVKVVHKLAEEGRIGVRHARTEARDRVKKLDKVSEDDKKHAEKDFQKLHDDHIHKLDGMLKAKEAEIMEV